MRIIVENKVAPFFGHGEYENVVTESYSNAKSNRGRDKLCTDGFAHAKKRCYSSCKHNEQEVMHNWRQPTFLLLMTITFTMQIFIWLRNNIGYWTWLLFDSKNMAVSRFLPSQTVVIAKRKLRSVCAYEKNNGCSSCSVVRIIYKCSSAVVQFLKPFV